MPRRPSYSDEDLAKAVALSRSVAEVLRQLGIRDAGGSHFHMSKRIKRAGLDTSHFLGKAVTKGMRRALVECGVPTECALCGIPGVWMGRPIVLHVDHVDGDARNDLLENLRLLCPNCHSQTPTFCRQMSARPTAEPVA